MISDFRKSINHNWFFKPIEEETYKKIQIPHTNQEVPYNYFDEKMYQFISCYKRIIHPKDPSKRIFLQFDGVMTAFKLYVNGQFVEEYRGGYIPHFIEITAYLQYDQENEIYVEVDSTEREDIPPFGHVVDYLTFGGIYRDVFLYELKHCFIQNVQYHYQVKNFSKEKGTIVLKPKVQINNIGQEKEYSIKVNIDHQEFTQKQQIKEGTHWYDLHEILLGEVDLWGLDHPILYPVQTQLLCQQEILDQSTIKVGFRHVKVDPTGLYINGEKIKIRGLNRHQSYPYVGYAMPKRAQIRDADILKEELGLNLARTSHYPQSPYFLQRCDEIGLLVMEEIPGWQHVSSKKEWRQQALQDVEKMILRDFNHPSIITWGVRINESQDDEELYKATNAVARKIDPSRPTCGVRCIEKSQFLEDIYSMNDFIHDGGEVILRSQSKVTGLKKPVPYIVTEFCGHIFPTKKFDNEQRLVEHALRHGRVQSIAREQDDYMGAIGWCAFDYYTHYDFGSGDRICYHGVMDMFRIPKYAAHLYKSQKSPYKEPVLEPLTWWSRGERNKGQVFPIYVCTNCDAIDVILGGKKVGHFTREENIIEENLKGLEYPPIKLSLSNGDWGSKWTEAEFIGYIGNEKVIVKKFVANPVVTDLTVQVDDSILNGFELDVTRIVVKVVDQYDNVLPYSNGFLTLETQGDIDIIGPKQVTFIGGSIAFWIKTLGKGIAGKGQVNIKSSFGIEKQVVIQIQE